MLDQFLGKLDTKMYLKWQEYASDVLTEIEQALSKITFDPPLAEMKAIQARLPVNGTLSPEEYAQTVQFIQEKINFFATKKDFNNKEINDFFFHAYRSLNNLMGSFLLTKLPHYGEAFFNPSGKPDREEIGGIQRKILSKAASFTENMLLDALKDNIALLHVHMQKIPTKSTVGKVDDLSPPTPILAGMGLNPSQLEELNLTQILDDPQAFFPFLTRKIYAFGFDSNYIHVASLCEIQSKIDKVIAEKERTPKEFEKAKKEELAKLGLASLSTPPTILYLDNMAKNLGFQSAGDLYHHYSHASQKEKFDAFKEKRARFIDFANQNSTKEDDPLEKIKSDASQEYQRVKNLYADQDNSTYCTLLSYYGSDNIGNIEVKQRLNNLGKRASQDHLPSLLSHLPRYATPLAKLASWLINVPEKLSTQFLGDLYTENDLLQKRLDNTCLPFEEKWVRFNESKINENQKNAERFFKMIENSPREQIIANLSAKQSEIKKEAATLAETNKKLSRSTLSNRERSSLESKFILSTEELDTKETTYLTLKAIFDYKTDKRLWEIPFETLEGTATELNNEKDQFVIQAEAALHAKERAYSEKEDSIIGRIILVRDKIATFFSIKTESMKVREDTLLRFKEEREKINTAEDIYKEQIHTLSTQQSLYKKLINTNSLDLADKILLWHEEYLKVKQDADPTNLRKSYELKRQKLFLENQLNMALTIFVEKETLDLGSIETQALLARLQEVMSLSTSEKDNLLLSRFKAMKDNLEKRLIEHKKMKQGDKIKGLQEQFNEKLKALSLPEIKNPFHIVSTEEIEVKVPLYQHIAARYAHQLDSFSSELTKKQLEDLFYNFKQGYYYHIEQVSSEHINIASFYDSLAKKVEALLDKRYEQLQALSPQDQKETLEALDADFIHYAANLKEKEEVVASAKIIYNAIWNIGYFFSSDATLLETNSACSAARDQYSFFAKKYKDFLEKYNAKTYFSTLDPAALSAHTARLKSHADEIKLLAKDPLVEDILLHYDAILKSAQQAEESEVKIKTLASTYSAFEKKSQEIRDEIRDRAYFNVDKYHRLKEGMKNLSEVLENKKAALLEVEKAKYMPVLDELSRKLTSLNQQISPLFEFYEKIVQQQQLTIPSLETEYLGKGLILAVEVKNETAIDQLLSPLYSLPIQDLAAASKLAASKGHFEIVKKIHKHPKDITFTQSDLFESIKAALHSGHTEIAYYLILDMPYVPNAESSEFLQTHLPLPTSKLSPIPKGLRQLLLDKDGAILDRLRQCFMCEEALLTATPFSIERLEKAIKVREGMISGYTRFLFDNPSRKDEALKTWREEIAPLEEAYRNKVTPMPLSSSLKNEEKKENIVIEKNTDTQNFENARKSFISLIENKKWDPSLLHTAYSHLRSLMDDKNEPLFYRTLSEAINYTARHDKEETLATLLVQIEDPAHKKELASNALFEALSEGGIHVINYLISENAFEGKESQIVEALFKIQQEKANGQNQTRHIHFARLAEAFLSNMPVTFDGRIQSIIQQIIDKKADSAVPPVEKGFFQWVKDNDYPFLEEMREFYLFSEKVYKDMSMKIFSDLRYRLDEKLGEKELKDFSPEEIKELELAYNAAQAEVAHQQNTLEDLRKACIERATIENKERMQKHIKRWEEALQPIKYNINDGLGDIKRYLDSYQKIVSRSEPIVFSHKKEETRNRFKEEKVAPSSFQQKESNQQHRPPL